MFVGGEEPGRGDVLPKSTSSSSVISAPASIPNLFVEVEEAVFLRRPRNSGLGQGVRWITVLADSALGLVFVTTGTFESAVMGTPSDEASPGADPVDRRFKEPADRSMRAMLPLLRGASSFTERSKEDFDGEGANLVEGERTIVSSYL